MAFYIDVATHSNALSLFQVLPLILLEAVAGRIARLRILWQVRHLGVVESLESMIVGVASC